MEIRKKLFHLLHVCRCFCGLQICLFMNISQLQGELLLFYTYMTCTITLKPVFNSVPYRVAFPLLVISV